MLYICMCPRRRGVQCLYCVETLARVGEAEGWVCWGHMSSVGVGTVARWPGVHNWGLPTSSSNTGPARTSSGHGVSADSHPHMSAHSLPSP